MLRDSHNLLYLLWLRYWSWPWHNTFWWLRTGSIWTRWCRCAAWSRGEARRGNGGDDVGAARAAPMLAAEGCVRDVYTIIPESVWPMSCWQKGSIISRQASLGFSCICMVVDLCLGLFDNFSTWLIKYALFFFSYVRLRHVHKCSVCYISHKTPK